MGLLETAFYRVEQILDMKQALIIPWVGIVVKIT
jgi:hypothetical protein